MAVGVSRNLETGMYETGGGIGAGMYETGRTGMGAGEVTSSQCQTQ